MAEKRYPGTRSGVAAGRSYPTPKTRGSGWEDQPHVQGAMAVRAQEGLEELSHVEGQEGRGKEQWLCFAGVAMKRYPTPKGRETQVRQ